MWPRILRIKYSPVPKSGLRELIATQLFTGSNPVGTSKEISMILKLDQRLKFMGHKLRVRAVKIDKQGYPARAVLTCAPQCCTTPRHVELEVPVDEFERRQKNVA